MALYDQQQVTSASVKPRLAGRQPSIRGGVPRVMTRPDTNRCTGKRGPPPGVPHRIPEVRCVIHSRTSRPHRRCPGRVDGPDLAGRDQSGLCHHRSVPAGCGRDGSAVAAELRQRAPGSRGGFPAVTEAYEQARQRIARFLGCRPDDQVVFTRHTTDAMNLLARALPPGTQVVTFASEHHANLLPWQQVVRLPVPASPAAAIEAVDTVLRRLRRSGHTAEVLVAVTGASNVTGERWPVAGFRAIARRSGARVAVDGAQLAPHGPIDLAALDVDYRALCGRK